MHWYFRDVYLFWQACMLVLMECTHLKSSIWNTSLVSGKRMTQIWSTRIWGFMSMLKPISWLGVFLCQLARYLCFPLFSFFFQHLIVNLVRCFRFYYGSMLFILCCAHHKITITEKWSFLNSCLYLKVLSSLFCFLKSSMFSKLQYIR